MHLYPLMFQLPTLRGCVLEDAIPASGRLSSSRGLPVKDLLEFVVPDLQLSCLRQAVAGQKTCDQLMKLDEQRVSPGRWVADTPPPARKPVIDS